jgi:hypothetical protein
MPIDNIFGKQTVKKESTGGPLSNIFAAPATATEEKTPKQESVIENLDEQKISQGAPDIRKTDTIFSKIGRVILPDFLEKELGIDESQRQAPELSMAEREQQAGTLITQKLIDENPEQISPFEYLRRGLSFGHNTDIVGAIESGVKGYKTTIDNEDLPEPITASQKISQAIGNVITMTFAQPLIESAITGLISKIPGGANILEKVSTASKISPYKIGYPVAVAKAAGEGGIFGLITKNKKTVAENTLESAGTFAAFQVVAYPIQMFFKPILQSVGTMDIQNPKLKNIINDPSIKSPVVSKTLWFKNPKDETEILKVTAHGLEFTDEAALVKAGVNKKNISDITSIDIEAFKEKPSIYQNLKQWISGKKTTSNEIPFTVRDTMPNSTPVTETSIDLPSGELRMTVEKPPKDMSTNELTNIKAALSSFEKVNTDTNIIVRDAQMSPVAAVNTVEISNGKFAVKVSADISDRIIITDYTDSKLYDTKADAIEAGKAEILDWVKNNSDVSNEIDQVILDHIQQSLNKHKPIIGDIPVEYRVAEPKKQVIAGDIPTLETKIKDIYKSAGQDESLPEFTKADKVLDEIYNELDFSKAGQRSAISINKGEGYEQMNTSTNSTFPDWIPEHLRRKELFDKVMGNLTIDALKIPDKNKTAQRELYNILLDKVDAELGVDTKTLREQINQTYEKATNTGGKEKIATGSDRGAGGSRQGNQKEIVKKTVSETPKSIKEIAKETGIKEPNIRRILGVGAKEGTFERVEEGVYVLSKDGNDIAWVETGNAVESLPRLAQDGFKADMVFLDIPYDTPAVKGGNRGVKYDLLSVSDFGKILDAIGIIAKTENSPVIHMYSQAESGIKAMQKYNDLFLEKGFKPVGKGQYQKTFADGSPVTSPNGKISRPEGILVFTKSGELNKDLKDLNFTLKRPKGYQTEKPAGMLKAMIEMTTNEGDIVLDPFAGSGVTGAEAIRAGRKAYLIERDAEVAKNITKERVKSVLPSTKLKLAPDFIDETKKLKNEVDNTPNKKLQEYIEKNIHSKDIISKNDILYRGSKIPEKEIVLNTDESASYGKGVYLSDNENIAKEYGESINEITTTRDLKLREISDDERNEIVSLFGKEQKDYINLLLENDKYDGFKIPERNGDGNEIVIYNKDLLEIKKELPAYSTGGKNASIGEFRDGTPVEAADLDKIKPIEMPEMVRLAREISGMFPKVRETIGRKIERQGQFNPSNGEIKLKASIFKDPIMAAKTLAHEIGHMVDWLPDKNMARGNLLGRILSLNRFMKSVFGTEEGMFGEQGIDLKRIRSDAFKKVLQENNVKYGQYITSKEVRISLKDKIKAKYTEMVDAVGGIRNSTVKKELQDLSEYWRPYDKQKSSASYVAYRNSSDELYADSISVLLNSPGLLKEKAPVFYKAFFDALDQKSDVKAAYFELQELLNGSTEEIFKARKEDIRKGFIRAEELQAGFANKKELGIKAFWEKLRQQLDDINYPILKKQAEAEAKGKIFAEEESPKFLLQENSYADNENFLLVEGIDTKIVKPIEEAGMTIDDMGEYLLLDRIQKDRADIANPFGFNPKNAAQQLEVLKKSVGDENYALLQEKVKAFHDIVFQSVEEAVRVGSYNKETFETKIKPNKDSYASFQVVDYMQEHMPATIKGQVGTLKEVANPFVSTILKTVALNRLNAYQRAKNGVIKMLKDDFTGEISETKRITSDGKLSIFKPAKDKGSIEVLEDGKMQSYDVDPYVAESFKKEKVGDLNVLVSLVNKFNNKLFKPVVTTYNLGFAAAFNPVRDFKRNYKLIGNATVLGLLKAYAQSLPSAIRYSKGQLDDFTRSLVESKAINAPVNDYNFDARDDELGRILERYGLIRKDEEYTNQVAETIRKAILRPTARVLEGIRFVANTFEIVSKVAGAKVRIKGGEAGKELAYNLRNFTGTPNYKVRGKQTETTNALFVFSNIMKEGLKSDFRIASDPKTMFGYWWKTAKIDLLPKFLMFLAGAGVFGATIKKHYDDMSEYDKTNYITIPIGTHNDKTVYVRVPHDENGRLVSAAFWKIMNAVKDGGDAKDLQDIFALGAGQLPSISPAISIGSSWLQYASGKNPYDAFRGRSVIDDTTWQAGGGAALKKMVQWTTNSLGFTKFATFDTSKNTGVETFMQVAPLFSNVVKISDYGQQEKLKEIKTETQTQEARQTLQDRELVDKYVKKSREEKTLFAASKYKKEIIMEALGGHMPTNSVEQDRADKVLTKFKRSLKRGSQDDSRVVTIIDAQTNQQKRAIIQSIKNDMAPDEFKQFKKGLLEDGIVKDTLFIGLK